MTFKSVFNAIVKWSIVVAGFATPLIVAAGAIVVVGLVAMMSAAESGYTPSQESINYASLMALSMSFVQLWYLYLIPPLLAIVALRKL